MKDFINIEKKYRIVSMKHTDKKDSFITLWGPNDAGYHFSEEMSGLYNGYVPGYHDSDDNMAVLNDRIKTLFIDVTYEGKPKRMIPNCKAVWDELGLKWSAKGLRRKEVTN